MRNSSISKSSSFTTSKKLSRTTQHQPAKYFISIRNSGQQNRQTSHGESTSEQNLFTPVRKSSIKRVEKKNQLEGKKGTPLFLGFSRKQEQGVEPNVEMNKSEKLANDLVRTKYTSKPSLENSINESVVVEEGKLHIHPNQQLQAYEQDPFIKQRQSYEGMIFGEGLEQIDEKRENGQFVSHFSIEEKSQGKSINLGEKLVLDYIIKGQQNKISSKRTLHNQLLDPDYRKTSKSFFKRSLNSSHSQGLNKPTSKQRQSRQSFFIKTHHQTRQSYNQRAMFRNSKAYLTIANNLDKLEFRYNGGYATTLYNYKLKVKNQSLVDLCVKVKCTSPKHYQVKPCSELTLQPLQIRTISIQLKLHPNDLNPSTMKHDLTRYKHDKFIIMYWTADSHSDFDYCEGQKILPVTIQQTEQQRLRNEGYTKSMNEMKTKQEIEGKEIQVYKKMIRSNEEDVKEVEGKIKLIQQVDYNHRYYGAPLFVVFAILGLGIGFCIG